MRLISIISIIIVFLANATSAQEIFHLEDFLDNIKKYHPIVQQGKFYNLKAEQNVMMARGQFDPKIGAEYATKQLNDKNYYSLIGGKLVIPTWYGIEMKAGMDQNTGTYINAENTTQNSDLWYSGISIPLGNGLFIDQRRADLKKSKIMIDLTQQEVKLMINDLLFNAIKQYWAWVESYNNLKIYEESVDLAYKRFEAVKVGYNVGDEPSIDTLEAYIQYQNRVIGKTQYKQLYKNETLLLSNYLWFENNVPLEISSNTSPPLYIELTNKPELHVDTSHAVIDTLIELHPKIEVFKDKLNYLDIEKRLKAEYLKPKLNLNYNLLNDQFPEQVGNFNLDNYKFGLNFSMPIFLRAERANYKNADIKILETDLEKNLTKLVIKNKVFEYINNLNSTVEQAYVFENMVSNYTRLLDAEKQKFEAGESSLFLINSRETKLIESKLKLIALRTKARVYDYGIDWSLGLLN